MGICVPVVKAEYCLMYYCAIPFHEDIRNYPFRTLSDVDVPPSDQKLMDDYVMALSRPNFVLKQVHNPVIQHYYQCLRARALDPTQAIPPIDPSVHKYCCHWGQEGNIMQDVGIACAKASKSMTPFSVTLKSKDDPEKRKKFWFAQGDVLHAADGVPTAKRVKVDPEMVHASNTTHTQSGGATTQGPGGAMSLDVRTGLMPRSGALHVGTTHPVEDFEDMIARRDQDLFARALAEIQEVIFTLLKHAVGTDLHAKCYKCVCALRRVCVNENAAYEFNSFMRHLKGSLCAEAFWKQHIVQSSITLIHNNEVSSAGVTPEEAKDFALTQLRTDDVAVFDDLPSDDEDQLFDQLE
jgi:ATP-dependent DNA helicase 2 subunit 2